MFTAASFSVCFAIHRRQPLIVTIVLSGMLLLATAGHAASEPLAGSASTWQQAQLDNTATASERERQDAADAQVQELFLGLFNGESNNTWEDLKLLRERWHPGMVPMVIETLRFGSSAQASAALIDLLEDKTGQDFGRDLNSWYRWLWQRDEQRHPYYASFKSRLYSYLDPLFAGYFNTERETTVRLDEIRWGGVRQDGIPPLRSPVMIDVESAD